MDRVLDGANRDAVVVVDEEARHPSHAESTRDETPCRERVARARDDARIEAGVATCEPEALKRSFDQTLTYLGVEQIDLFLIHWPLPTLYDGDYLSTWKAVAQLKADGQARSVGVSNFQPAHLARIIAETGIVPAVNQVELHPYFANRAVLEACAEHGIAVEAHSPLGHNNAELDDPRIQRIAEAHQRSVAQVILRWHIQHGYIAIPKSARPERMAENIDVFDFELDGEEMAAIDGLDRGESGRVGPNPDTYEGV